MTDLPHPLEKYLVDSYGLDRERLERLGIFLLGHLLMDQRLIAAVAADMVKKGSGSYANLSLAEWQDIVTLAAERTFLRHLNEAKARSAIPDRLVPLSLRTQIEGGIRSCISGQPRQRCRSTKGLM